MLTELTPIAVPSIDPPFISAEVAVKVVKVPGAAVVPPIVVLSIVPPSQSKVPATFKVFPVPHLGLQKFLLLMN